MIFKWNHNIKLPNLEFLGYHSEITQQKKDPKGLSNRSSSSSLGFVFPKRKKFFQNVYIFSTSAIDQGCHTFETPSFGFSKVEIFWVISALGNKLGKTKSVWDCPYDFLWISCQLSAWRWFKCFPNHFFWK